jgi:hypothetical protein
VTLRWKQGETLSASPHSSPCSGEDHALMRVPEFCKSPAFSGNTNCSPVCSQSAAMKAQPAPTNPLNSFHWPHFHPVPQKGFPTNATDPLTFFHPFESGSEERKVNKIQCLPYRSSQTSEETQTQPKAVQWNKRGKSSLDQVSQITVDLAARLIQFFGSLGD